MTRIAGRPLRASLAFAAAVCLGVALRLTEGHFVEGRETSLWLVVLATAVALGAFFVPDRESDVPATILWLPTFATLLASLCLVVFSAGIYLTRPLEREIFPLFLAGGLAVIGAHRLRRLDRRTVLVIAGALAGASVIAGIAVLVLSPAPLIDVWSMQQAAAEALLHGQNPYAMQLPDIVTGTKVDYYPYAPLPMVLTIPGWLLAGDVRASLLAAGLGTILLAGALASPDATAGFGKRAAIILVAWLAVRPTGTFQLEQAWNEPFAVALFAASMLLWRNGRLDAAAAVFGLAIACKQYLFVVGPMLVLFPHARFRHLVIAGAVTVATFVPFAIVDAKDLIEDTILVHVRWAPRYDALTINSWLHARFGLAPIGALSAGLPLAAFAAIGFRGLTAQRRIGRAMIGIAAVLLAAFIVAKQAHANYYDLAEALLVLGAIAELTDAPVLALAGVSI